MKEFYKNPYAPSLDAIGLVEKVKFGIDAISLVVEGDSNIAGLREIWQVYEQKGRKEGWKVSQFKSHGYIGGAIKSVRHGYKKATHSALFQITGEESQSALVELIELEGYATRVDLCATFQMSEAIPELAKFIHEARVYVGSTRGVKASDYIYISGKEGDTLYIGNRQSSKMLRIYDKSHEYQAPRGTIWRWEMQYNRDAARAIWIAMDGLERNDLLFKSWIARRLFEDCHAKGVRLPVGYGPVDDASLPPKEPAQTDRERYLKWMRETVSPVVKWLTARGEQDLVLEALGIMALRARLMDSEDILSVVTELVGENVSRETIEIERA